MGYGRGFEWYSLLVGTQNNATDWTGFEHIIAAMDHFVLDRQAIIPMPDLSWRDVHGELVVIEIQSGKYHIFNEVGGLIWLAICEGSYLDDTLNKITKRFSVDAAVAAKELRFFVSELIKRGLLHIDSTLSEEKS